MSSKVKIRKPFENRWYNEETLYLKADEHSLSEDETKKLMALLHRVFGDIKRQYLDGGK